MVVGSCDTRRRAVLISSVDDAVLSGGASVRIYTAMGRSTVPIWVTRPSLDELSRFIARASKREPRLYPDRARAGRYARISNAWGKGQVRVICPGSLVF